MSYGAGRSRQRKRHLLERRWLLLAAGMLFLTMAACDLPFFPLERTPAVPTVTPRSPSVSVVVATPTSLPESLLGEIAAGELLLINLYDRVNPGVVNINVAAGAGADASPFGSGSGFLIDAEGHIVTNQHVVEGADEIWITFSDGSLRQAELLGADPYADLAALLVEDLPPGAVSLELGDSDVLEVGQQVVAIGNPFGLEGTMTGGIISALGRTLPSRVILEQGSFSNPEIIQTDAAINPGNSGGPLLDSGGRVVGVNTAIQTTLGGNMGVGFAVPVATVQKIVPHLIAEGEYWYPYLGITYDGRLTMAQLARELDLPTERGVLISTVEPGTAAERAGLRGGDEEVRVMGMTVNGGGDIIVAIDDYQVEDFHDLISYLVRETEVGQVVVLAVLRDGETLEIPVELGERP
jgi:S1-C subfamily serine protease